MLRLVPVLVCLLLATMPSLAAAQDDPGPDLPVQTGTDWYQTPFRIVWNRKSLQDSTGDVVSAEAQDRYGEPVKGSVAFLCVNRDFMVAITYKAVPVTNYGNLWNTPNLRNTKAELIIDGEKQGFNGFTRSKDESLLLPQSKKDSARLYNAVLRQTPVLLRWSGAGTFALHLPPSNESFREFGAECGLGIHGKGVRQKA